MESLNFIVTDKLVEFPKGIQFRYSWRKYQQRVLNDLEGYLANRHLHIIAPPGSGKTVLGLEVAIRLNKPTLILAPTIAIRNQWIQRFCKLFLQTEQVPDWVSRDIRNPGFMTVVTYQGLHAACNNLYVEAEGLEEEEESEICETGQTTNQNFENVLKSLQAQKVQTIVLDEAHHLKNEWWQTISKVKEKLDPVIVGLTATPPYDVSPTEWQRYTELNGPVDTEITVPELVIEGDLCPHQDYVFFSLPTEIENQSIIDFRQDIEKLFQEIRKDETLLKAVENHPVWMDPVNNLDWIYSNLPFYSACLIFLKANGKEIQQTHLEVIGDKQLEIPEFDYSWTETLLDFYLNKEREHFKDFEEHRKLLENKLKRFGAMERRQISFLHNRRVTGFLTSSISKLNGIKEIVDFEYQQLGKDLRLVILSDYIRKEFFINATENKLELKKMGVVPIFEKLRRENPENKKIGVLTGSIIILPKSAWENFEAKATDLGVTRITSSSLPFDSNYILLNQSEQLKNDIVHIVTQIFEEGEIEVLIGTKSLLGEGWDAPAINSLILASFVGSFVLSNQMRGRAIRTQSGNLEKTGNIWHLVCVDPTTSTGGDDFELLKRLFKSFVGVSFNEESGIENGIGRLDLPGNISERYGVEKNNQKILASAGDRQSLKQRWETALQKGISLVEEIKIPFEEEKGYQAIKTMYFNKTIANLLAALSSALIGFGLESLQAFGRAARNIKTPEDLYFFLAIIGSLGVITYGRLTFKTLRLYFKYRDISKDIHQIGNALLNTLAKAGIIQTEVSKLKIETEIDNLGAVYCHLEGGTTFERSIFINALQEVIAPIENPRYVIVRKSKNMLFIKQLDFHSVPEILGRNKSLADYFQSQWQNLVGNCELIFTRTWKGESYY